MNQTTPENLSAVFAPETCGSPLNHSNQRANFNHLFHNFIKPGAASNLFTITEVEPLYTAKTQGNSGRRKLGQAVTYFSDSDDSSDGEADNYWFVSGASYATPTPKGTFTPPCAASTVSLRKHAASVTRAQNVNRPGSSGATQAWTETKVARERQSRLSGLTCCCFSFTRKKDKVSVLVSSRQVLPSNDENRH